MNEYISREETAKAFCEKCIGYYDGHCIHRGECDIDVITTAPAADVQPVKRGKWENTNTPNQLRCSNCEIIHLIAQYPHGDIKYCPNCGARMGLGDEKT